MDEETERRLHCVSETVFENKYLLMNTVYHHILPQMLCLFSILSCTQRPTPTFTQPVLHGLTFSPELQLLSYLHIVNRLPRHVQQLQASLSLQKQSAIWMRKANPMTLSNNNSGLQAYKAIRQAFYSPEDERFELLFVKRQLLRDFDLRI